ncbi:unnamed protein product, partial [Closterium sp. Naga37s-1]
MTRGSASCSLLSLPLLTALLALHFLASLPVHAAGPVVPIDVLQAQALAESVGVWGVAPTGWSGGVDCSQVQGVTCDSDGTVVAIDLANCSLSGYIPVTFSSLTSLSLLLATLSLSPPLLSPQSSRPSSYCALPSPPPLSSPPSFLFPSPLLIPLPAFPPLPPTLLFLLSFSTLLSCCPFFPHLPRRDLSHNSLWGTMPSFLSLLENLRRLDLRNSSLGGTIPAGLGMLPNLRFLDLSSNHLNSAVPATLGRLNSPTLLDLSHNSLWGTMPSFLSLLENLRRLDLSSCSFIGTVPGMLSYLTRLHTL